MKQKIAVRAIIKQDGKILLVRRFGGRPSIAGLYELPGGRVHINQQPEDALAHALDVHLGVITDTIQLDDVMTFIDPDDRELQYVFIVFQVSLRATGRDINLSAEYDKYAWKKLSNIQLNHITQSTQQLLKMVPMPLSPQYQKSRLKNYDVNNASFEHITIFSDGGSRGNPGPSASGYVLFDVASTLIFDGGAYLGITTNDVAEYQAVYLALEKALSYGARTVDMRMDSQLVVNQLNGTYRSKQPDLEAIHHRIQELSAQFDKVTYTHVAREYNTLADGIVNKILDEHKNTVY